NVIGKGGGSKIMLMVFLRVGVGVLSLDNSVVMCLWRKRSVFEVIYGLEKKRRCGSGVGVFLYICGIIS
ncbi:hypothetical protein, partial [Bacillus altitudinis]|uniref:hypothetical protein n=1 Tax=Bacillus altitudinis TaxID=293387 RepID=UPI001C930A56